MSARSFRRARRRDMTRENKHRTRRGEKAVIAGAALGATVLFAPAADAATFTVTSLADDNTQGTLREEIYDANANAGADTIVFASGLTGEITLGSDDNIVIDDPLTIQGPGAGVLSVSGDDTYQIFEANNADSFTISGLTLTEGFYAGFGGALYVNETDLTVTDMVFTGNYASDGASISSFTDDVVITNSTFTGNTTSGDAPGLYTAADTVSISGSTFRDNDAGQEGGAVYIDGSALTIQGSTLAQNTAGGTGGAIYIDDTAGGSGNDVVISDSAISDNTSDDSGGGIYLNDIDGPVLIQRTTIAGDDSVSGYGGGIYAR